MNWPLRLAQSVIPKRLHWFFHLKHSEIHGRARWMNGREMQAFLPAGHDGLAFGLGKRLSREESCKNLVLLAPTGSGKTTRYVIPNLLQLQGSAVVTDPSGEIYRATSGALARRGYRIQVLQPAAPQASLGFNPLACFGSPQELRRLATILCESGETAERFWTIGAVNILTLCLKVLSAITHRITVRAERKVVAELIEEARTVRGKTGILFKVASAVTEAPDGVIDLQREMIATKVAETRPDLALDLMWRFMDLAEPILNRVDDSHGDVGDVFRQACRDLGALAGKAMPDPIQLADRVFQAVTTNDYGEYDQLIHVIFSALREPGSARLKSRLSSALAERPKTNDRYDPETATLQRALQAIADGEGDVDAYMAHESAASRKSPKVAAEIATRLLAAGRAEEAHAVLEEGSPELGRPWSPDWELAWVEALLATERRDEAQSFRWSCFERRLDTSHLRAYLKALPDFEDVLVEEKALDYALTFPDFSTALAFFISWKEPRYAARLVLERSAESDGNAYFLLDPAAKAIEGKHPLAATLLRRAMIEDTLNGAKYKRYRHAARHMLECQALDPSIEDYAAFETHDAFVNRIRAKHGRKTGFWSHVAELTASPAAQPQI